MTWDSMEIRKALSIKEGLAQSALRDDAMHRAKTIADLLKREYGVSRVILYGSLAEGAFHERSDIDILIEGFSGCFWEMYSKADRIAGPFTLSIVCKEDAEMSLVRAAESRGVIL